MQPRPIFLHDVTGDDVFEGFVEFRQLVEALFDHVGRPLVDFGLLVGVAADGVLDCVLDDGGDLVDDEGGLLARMVFLHHRWPPLGRLWCFQSLSIISYF